MRKWIGRIMGKEDFPDPGVFRYIQTHFLAEPRAGSLECSPATGEAATRHYNPGRRRRIRSITGSAATLKNRSSPSDTDHSVGARYQHVPSG